jgi:hypothetical protein
MGHREEGERSGEKDYFSPKKRGMGQIVFWLNRKTTQLVDASSDHSGTAM